MRATTRRARADAAHAVAPRNLRFAMGASINPTVFGDGQSDAVPRFGLAERARLGAKLRRMAARQTFDVQPQMNHLVLENFSQRHLAVTSSHAADLMGRAARKRVYKKGNGKRNHPRLNANVARRSR